MKKITENPYFYLNHKYAFMYDTFQQDKSVDNKLKVLGTIYLENGKEILAMI